MTSDKNLSAQEKAASSNSARREKSLKTSEVNAFRRRMAKPDEVVEFAIRGWIGKLLGQRENRQRNGHLLLTNLRSVFYLKGLFTEVCDSIAHEKVTGVDRKRGLHGQISIHGPSTILHFATFQMSDLDEFQRQLDHHIAVAAQRVIPTAGVGTITDQLEKLAALKDRGILTEAEFMAQKKKLLGI